MVGDGRLALPEALVAAGYRLRPETDADLPFLFDLYASTREAEMAMATGWSEAQKRAFLEQQFAAQRHHYRTLIDGCTFEIIERGGVPVGRLYLQRRVTQWHIVDVALVPAARGQGLGTALLLALADAAALDGRGLGIFVERYNPALALYRRLGFVEIAGHDIYLEMERPAGAAPVDQLNTAS